MESYITIALVVLAGIAGFILKGKAAKRAEVKRKVKDAAATEEEGSIDASIEFADRVAKAKAAVDAAIAARPVTDDPAADLADRIERRRARRKRKPRQRDRADNPTDWG